MTTKGYYTSQKITASTRYEPYCTRGFMHSMDDLSKYQTGEDALAHIRTQLAEAINKHQTAKLVSQLEGIFETALADNSLDVLNPPLAQKMMKTCSLCRT